MTERLYRAPKYREPYVVGITTIQRRCLIEATIAPLFGYRRGYARNKRGPFYPRRTVQSLLKTGALVTLHDGHDKYKAVTVFSVEQREKI